MKNRKIFIHFQAILSGNFTMQISLILFFNINTLLLKFFGTHCNILLCILTCLNIVDLAV